MNKKVLIIIGILIIVVALLGVYFLYISKAPTKEQIIEKFSQFKIEYQEKKTQGHDVREAEELIKQAKQAFDKGNYKIANQLLDKAFDSLRKAQPLTQCGDQTCQPEEDGYNCPSDCCISDDGLCRKGCTSENDNDCEIEKVEKNCLDKIDNDEDGKTDCDDPDCFDDPACLPTAQCGNNTCESGENGFNCPQDCCVSGDGVCRSGCTPENDDDCEPIEVKVETICTDGLDNDGDGLIDNEDGDCWIREGVIYEANLDYFPNRRYSDLTERIPELKELGIKTIYLLPIFKCKEGLPYSIYNYSLNPIYGSEDDLHNLIDTIHTHDMKVLFDLVLSYSPEGSYIYEQDSMMLYYKPEYGGGIYFWRWEPSTNQMSADLIEYISDVAKSYVQEYSIDGWRVDAPQLNFNQEDSYKLDVDPTTYSSGELLRRVKEKITSVKADAVLYAEHPGTYTEVQPMEAGCDFDEMCECSYNWYFSGWLRWWGKFTYQNGFLDKVVNNQATSADLVNFLSKESSLIEYNRTRAHFSECHDTLRVNLAFPEQNRALLTLISTIPGIPMIQGGQDIGTTKKHSINWDSPDYELRDFYKKVLNIRNTNNALKYGSIENVWKSGDNTYAYLREYEDEKVIVVINFLDKQATSYLDLSFLDKGTLLYDELNGEEIILNNPSNFKISIPAYGSRMLTLK